MPLRAVLGQQIDDSCLELDEDRRIGQVRALAERTVADVPRRVEVGVALRLTARHTGRYIALARLLIEHHEAATFKGRSANNPPEIAGDGGSQEGDLDSLATQADRLVAEFESMGPTFVKLGQLLSTRSDLLPQPYLDALSQLRDNVTPLPPGTAEEVIERELNIRISTGFGSFDPVPMGSASLAQVHRATMRDGRRVAVKVQRPGIERQVIDDMEVVAELASWLDDHSMTMQRFGFLAMVEEFRRTTMRELDYRLEARNMRVLGEQLARYPRIVVPQPVPDYCTGRVLTMELVNGRSAASLGPLARLDIEGGPLADELFRSFLDQVLVSGFFHADLHPGNVLLTDDGRLAIIDAGMVARLSTEVREHVLRLLIAVSDGDPEHASAALEALGEKLDDFDPTAMQAAVADVVAQLEGSSIEEVDTGRLLGDLARASAQNGLRPPPELTMLARALLNLDSIARILDPAFDPSAAVRRHAAHVTRHGILGSLSPARLLSATLEAKELADTLPARLNKVLDALSEGRFTVNVEGVEEAELMRVVQKLANRVAMGVVIAALLLTAGLFSRSGSASKLWGYPVITVTLLLAALGATLWLAIGILRSDLPQRHRRSRPYR